MMTRQAEHLWFRLNGYGVLLALLEILTGVLWLLDPPCALAGCQRVPLVGVFVNGTYTLSGLGLLVAFWRANAALEVFAGVAMVVANLTETIRQVLFGDPTGSGLTTVAVSMMVATCVTMRLSALLRGGTFILPRWERRP